MPSGLPTGQLGVPGTPHQPPAQLDPTAGLSVSAPQNPLDVIGSDPSPTAAIGSTPSPLGNMPDMKTMMLPAPQQFQSRSALSNIAATNAGNKNMLRGSMPSGPRAAIPGGYPPGPSASPGAAPAPAAGPPAGPAGILAQPGLGKRGSAPFEFGKAALEMPPQGQPMDPKMLAVLSLLAGGGAAVGGAGLGAAAGGVLGTAGGAARGDAVEGLGRGVIRGGLTGAGAGIGSGVGGALGALSGNESLAQGGAALGALGGGLAGYAGGGAILGKPKGRDKQSAAFNFGTDIARTMKPRTVTRHEGEYRGADMKTNLAKHGC